MLCNVSFVSTVEGDILSICVGKVGTFLKNVYFVSIFVFFFIREYLLQEGEPLLTERVWEALVKAFANQMKSAYTASSFVKEIFTLGYPRLFSMVENLLDRISRDTDVKGVLPALGLEGREQMVGAIQTFQISFLALCLSRLSDYVNTIFPVSSRGTIPSKDQISRLVSRIQEEIEVVRMHGPLLHLVLREIAKVLHLLAERAEYQVLLFFFCFFSFMFKFFFFNTSVLFFLYLWLP